MDINNTRGFDTKHGINSAVTESDLAGSKLAAEATDLRIQSKCPMTPPERPEGMTLVAKGEYNVPDKPGLVCEGGFIEIKPIWTEPNKPKPNENPGKQVQDGKVDGQKPKDVSDGYEGDGTTPKGGDFPEGWSPKDAKPMPMPRFEAGDSAYIPEGATDNPGVAKHPDLRDGTNAMPRPRPVRPF